MSARTAARLAWSVCAFSLVLTAVGLLFVALNLSHPNVPGYDYWVQSSATGMGFRVEVWEFVHRCASD